MASTLVSEAGASPLLSVLLWLISSLLVVGVRPLLVVVVLKVKFLPVPSTIAVIAETRRDVLPRLIAHLLSVLLWLISSLLVVGVRPLLVVVVLKVKFLPAPSTIAVIAVIAETRRDVLPRLIAPLLSVLLWLISSLLVVGVRPLLLVVVLKVKFLPVPSTIVVDEA
ncbi:hypothetical protein DY000_02029362 [Brassica cretica]|uniref:Uncharacterized protein n=1 Tax=Brassica cretica TaxID=69181 RepID=A0ABQ7E052_BRACR|nr:hypothetical protein DY000_02029362 [Brassica cretica]